VHGDRFHRRLFCLASRSLRGAVYEQSDPGPLKREGRPSNVMSFVLPLYL
jgi:hypothetical protein